MWRKFCQLEMISQRSFCFTVVPDTGFNEGIATAMPCCRYRHTDIISVESCIEFSLAEMRFWSYTT